MSAEEEYYNSAWHHYSTSQKDIERIISIVDHIPADVSSILDVGCGDGFFLNYLLSTGKPYTLHGVDRSPVALERIMTEKTLANIAELPFKDNEFDLVTSMECIEHLPYPVYSRALQEISRIARKYVLLTVPNNEDIQESMCQCPLCKGTFNISQHFRSFDKIKLTNLLKPYGFSAISIQQLPQQRLKYLFINKLNNFIKGYPPPINRSCLICNAEFTSTPTEDNHSQPSRKASSTIKNITKIFWPKKSEAIWLMALYKK